LKNNFAKRNFKKFRQSDDFKPVAKEIANATKKILQHCTRVESGFESLNICTLINEYAEGKSDFNDQVISLICSREKLTLVTDDKDFANEGVAVLTANKKLLDLIDNGSTPKFP